MIFHFILFLLGFGDICFIQAEEDNGINGDERIDYKYTDETGY